MNKEEIDLKKLAKDRNFKNEIKTIFQYKILDKITKIGNEQIYEIIDYLQNQLDKSNNKIEKIKEYINITYAEWYNWKKDIKSIIDGSDE